MDDAALTTQVLRGSPEAFRLLVVRYERPLFRFLGLLGFGPSAVEDLAQETFLRAYRALGEFDASRAQFSTWLFMIAKRLAHNEHRRRRQAIETLEPGLPEPASPEANPAERARTAERLRRVQAALHALEEPLRTTFVFAQLEGIELDEIAVIQGCAVGTVKSRIHRAREILRSAMTDEKGDAP